MTRTRLTLVGAAFVAAAVPACVQLPSSSRDAVARGQSEKPATQPVANKPPSTSAETSVSRSPAEPRLQYIDLRSVKVSPADPPPEVTQVKAEQPTGVGPQTQAPPAKLDLPRIDSIPVVESPTNPAPQGNSPILTALRYYQADSPDRATQALDPLDPGSRDMLKALLPLAARLGAADGKPATAEEVTATVAQLEAAAAALRPNAALRIARLCYCRPVQAPTRFGVYQPLEGRHAFRPGEVVAVYVEMRNFTCEPKGDIYQSHLGSKVEVLDAAGHVAHRFDFDAADASLSPRQDYCHVGRFLLPRLPAGDYILRLTVTDRPTKREAQSSLDLRVAAAETAGN
ncbi:MAG TPA: hypothetical protein VL371_18605 [Gemmataceae bacterium]|jgi:hypothetical protein|nr:hypothetical protein [Gemmataceae bacterium]